MATHPFICATYLFEQSEHVTVGAVCLAGGLHFAIGLNLDDLIGNDASSEIARCFAFGGC